MILVSPSGDCLFKGNPSFLPKRGAGSGKNRYNVTDGIRAGFKSINKQVKRLPVRFYRSDPIKDKWERWGKVSETSVSVGDFLPDHFIPCICRRLQRIGRSQQKTKG